MATADLNLKGQNVQSRRVADGLSANSKDATSGAANGPQAKGGLKISQQFCPVESNPFDTVRWEIRSAAIKDEGGQVLFEQNDCEIPESWSQLATNVVVSKYFYGEPGTPERENSVRQLIHRVTRTIADWGIADGYFDSAADGERFYNELSWLCLHQCGSFNSPVWFNVGLFQEYGVVGAPCTWTYNPLAGRVEQPDNPYEYPQGSACFIQSVADNMEDIMRLASSEAMLFKFGSGTGTDLSTIRSRREKLSGGGTPSGPLSFMKVYDSIAGVVKSGGKTRRAAKMQSLKVSHPDILEFIECKWNEERKAHALIREGYEANFNGEAYSSVFFQNANLSVRLSDQFMEAVREDRPWQTTWVNAKSKGTPPTHAARELLGRMADCAWHCGDPGVQYDTTINNWHTCPNSGPINASNPCSEYFHLDNSACNWASLNLMKFRQADGPFDTQRFQAACRLFFIAQEILVGHASYPTQEIAANSHRYRPLGLGYSNLGSLIMTAGLAYDSEEARGMCGSITSLLHGAANLASAELAGVVGPFEGYAPNREPMQRVMRMHRDAVDHVAEAGPAYLKKAAKKLWDDVVGLGEQNGYRNAQATVLAPTGTISFMMDCDTTGIEPDIALVKYKQLAGGGMLKIVNRSVALGLETLGYTAEQTKAIVDYVNDNDTIEGAPFLDKEHLPVFDCAFKPAKGTRSIAWQAHVQMMAAAQPFLSGAISKTVNMPHDVTTKDIADAYFWGWELGLKAIAIYRDGSKQSQPLNTQSEEGKENERVKEKIVYKPRRERLPDTRQSITHKFNISGHEGYLNVGLYPDGRPGELFITMAKEGSTVGGLMDSFGTAISLSLQYGVPLEVLVNKFSHTRFEPMGNTTNPDIRIAKSMVDYIFRWMGITFLAGYREASSGQAKGDTTAALPGPTAAKSNSQEKAIAPPKAPRADGNGALAVSDEIVTAARYHGGASAVDAKSLERAGVSLTDLSLGGATVNRNGQFAGFQSDAPSCDNCGAITVRNGNCYLCHNCGNSMGCS
ncbi:MAG: vitamin B12-dependent ribonucleotide reductase [Planctomycetales bacterium]|nr:vitamin B12-dependent ribonucleotide reductase [Planctomycetales bacterium]